MPAGDGWCAKAIGEEFGGEDLRESLESELRSGEGRLWLVSALR